MRDWHRVGLPLLIWAVAAGTIAIAARIYGYHPFDSATWSRWDSVHYLGIARNGYDLYPCPPGIWDKPDAWCGDAGWFPAYSWAVGSLHLLGLPLRGTAAALSWLFAAGTIVLLWSTFFARQRSAAVLLALVYAAWAPGQIYHYAIFPLSMLAFFTIAHLWLLQRGRLVAAGLTGAVAVLSYPLGVLLVPVSALWLLLERRASLAERMQRVARCSGIALAGFAVLLLDQRLETGHWDAYFLVQSNYGHALQNPIAATRDSLRPLVEGPFNIYIARALQTAIVTIALVAVFVHAALRRHQLERMDLLLLFWAFATWAFPLSEGAVSLQRSQAALLPLAILVCRLPKALIAALFAAAVPVALLMEHLFLDGKIT